VPTIRSATLLLALTAGAMAQGQSADVAGEWQVVHSPTATPSSSSSPLGDWLRALPGAVFTLTHTAVPPLLLMHKDAQYRWIPSSPTITISQGVLGKPAGVGFLQLQADGRFEGELASSGGCWMHLSLQESEDGSTLPGSANINTKISNSLVQRSFG
jgi:hypothetical protein